MKKLLLVFFTAFLGIHCNNSSGDPANNTTQTGEGNIQLAQATPEDYQTLAEKDKANSPVRRLCQESKGYNIDQWLGLNECSWAIEKYQIEKYATNISRKDSLLLLQMEDQTMSLVHQLETPATYYQFIDYLPNSKHYVIKVFQQSACPAYWLINSTSGQKTTLPGRPVFTANRDAFLLSTSMLNNSGDCPNKLAYWLLQDQTFTKVKEQPAEAAITQLLWQQGTSWLGKQGEEIIRVSL